MAAAVAFLQTAGSGTDASLYSFTSQSIGVAAADRRVAVGVHAVGITSGATITSVTVAGVACDEAVDLANGTGQTGLVMSGEIAAGTTGTIAVQFSGTKSACGIAAFRVTGIATGIAADTVTDLTGDPASGVIDVPANGILIAAWTGTGGGTGIWAGVTERYDFLPIAGFAAIGAADAYATLQTDLAISLNSSADSATITFVGASWAPLLDPLAPGLFTNTPTIFAPTVTAQKTLSPSLVTNVPTFPAPTVSPGVVTLLPALVTNTSTFPAATVSVGPVSLLPGLFTNSPTIFAPTVGQLLVAPLFTNTPTFFSPTVSPGAVSLLPGLFTNTPTFPAATVTNLNTLLPSLFTNSPSIFAPSVTSQNTLLPGLFTNSSSFFAPAITAAIFPDLFVNSPTIFDPSLLASNSLLPSLVPSELQLFVPDVIYDQFLTAPFIVNVSVIFAPSVPFFNLLLPPLFGPSAGIFLPQISRESAQFRLHSTRIEAQDVVVGSEPLGGDDPLNVFTSPFASKDSPFVHKNWDEEEVLAENPLAEPDHTTPFRRPFQ